MHTREILTYLQRKASQYTSEELLFLVDQIQKIVYSVVTAQTTVIDPATGMSPFLATTDGVFTYNCPANCLRTLSIFADSLSGYRSVNNNAPLSYYNYQGRQYRELRVKSTDAYRGQVATVTFIDNPGTYASRYYHDYKWKPIDITSPNIQMQIPEQFHLDIVDGVLSRIRDERFGDKGDWLYWKQNTMPGIVAELNKGAQLRLGYTPIRPEYQNYNNSPYGQY